MAEVRMGRQSEASEQEELPVEGYSFFMPSTELTNAIIEQNQRLVGECIEKNLPSGYRSIQNTAQVEDGSHFGRMASELLRSEGPVDAARQIRMGQLLISERLYHYLSSLAETPLALEGGQFPIWEYIPTGMGTMLGLSTYGDTTADTSQTVEIQRLLEKLTNEFRDWLVKEHGSFVTPWFEIELTDDDALILESEELTTEHRPIVGEAADYFSTIAVDDSEVEAEAVAEDRMFGTTST